MAHASVTLQGEGYPTLALVLPTRVKLLQNIKAAIFDWEVQKEASSRFNATKRLACDAAIAFGKKIMEDIVVRADPYDFGPANHPYLVASFLHPGFKQLQFYPEEGGVRADALKAAQEFCVEDMEGVARLPFVPEWAQVEARRYAAAAEEGYSCAAAAAAPGPAVDAGIASTTEETGEPPAKRPRWDESLLEAYSERSRDEQPCEETVVHGPRRPSNLDMVQRYTTEMCNTGKGIQDTVAILGALHSLVKENMDYTLLVRVALRYAHTPASSSASERVWSTGTNTLVKSRRALSGNNVAALIYVSCNQHLVKI
jgi:hypothetical protein